MNNVSITGRITADPTFRSTQSGISNATFTVAVNRPYAKDREQEADFINCVAWRNTAEFISRNFRKGDPMEVTGSLRTRSYEKDGVKHFVTEVLVNDVSFTQSKKGQSSNEQTARSNVQSESPAEIGDLNDFEEILSDGDCPF